MSDEEFKLRAMLVTEGAGEARQGPDGMSSALSVPSITPRLGRPVTLSKGEGEKRASSFLNGSVTPGCYRADTKDTP